MTYYLRIVQQIPVRQAWDIYERAVAAVAPADVVLLFFHRGGLTMKQLQGDAILQTGPLQGDLKGEGPDRSDGEEQATSGVEDRHDQSGEDEAGS